MQRKRRPPKAAPTTLKKGLRMTLVPESLYLPGRRDSLVRFDLREISVVKSLHLRRRALQNLGKLEFIDEGRVLSIRWHGGARRLGA